MRRIRVGGLSCQHLQQPSSLSVRSKNMPDGLAGSMGLALVRVVGNPPSSAAWGVPADASDLLIVVAVVEFRADSDKKQAKMYVELQFASGVMEFDAWSKEQDLY